MWIFVDPVARESTLEFVAGSQRGPWLMPHTFLAKYAHPGDVSGHRLGAGAGRHAVFQHAYAPRLGRHGWADAATCVLRAFSVRFIGDDIRRAKRPWRTAPEFPGLAQRLPEGAPMDHPLFPALWRAGS
jgi:hypothetical protein